MLLTDFFEIIMLICFGCAWPVSIYKSYKARSNKGKSLFFLYIILFGYVNGVIYQYLASPDSHFVFLMFAVNMGMVTIDIIIYYRNSRIERIISVADKSKKRDMGLLKNSKKR